MTEANVLKEYREAYQQAFRNWQLYLDEADKDMKFYLGDQFTAEEKAYLRSLRRNIEVFNKIRRVVHLITGYQRKNRLALVVQPQEAADDITADQLSMVLMWIMQYANGYNVMSEAFSNGALKTGINLVSLYLDYSEDMVNGDIRFKRVPYNSFLLDPYFSERDLSDCKYIIYRRYMHKDEAKVLLPGKEKEIEEIEAIGSDGWFPYLSKGSQWSKKNIISYNEFWVKDSVKNTYVIDTETSEVRKWEGTKKDLAKILKEYPRFKKFEKYDSSVKRIIVVNDVVMDEERDPYGVGTYPFVPVIGFWDSEYRDYALKLQGIVRCMRDPQKEINKRRSKMLDILDSQLNSGWIAKEGAVRNPRDLYQSGQGGVVWRTDDSSSDDIQRVDPPQVPTALFQLSDTFEKDIMEIPGANTELFGMPENDNNVEISAVLAKVRQASGLTVLQELFDNYRMSKALLGRLLIKMVQNNYSPQKIARIINQEPSQQFYMRDFGKYDCIVEEGLITDSQRQLYYTQLLQLKMLGAPIPWTAILEAAPIQGKKKIRDMIAQQEQQAQAQAQQAQVQQQLQQQLAQAKIMRDISLAKQREAKAIEEQQTAAMRRQEVMKRIEKLDTDHVIAMADFLGMGNKKKITKR